MEWMGKLEGWYKSYVASFAGADGVLPYMSQLKVAHSRRVAMDCRAIAEEMGWGAAELDGAEAMGLLHDVSRYQQVRDYGTFLDARSFDHGERAWSICREFEVFAGWPSELAAAVLHGIRFHNRRVLEEGATGSETRFLRLIRDADKLDILKVVNEVVRTRSYEQHPEVLLNIAIDGPISQDLINEIRAHRSASYAHVRSLSDMNLLRTTWVYDINYLPTLRRLRDRRLLVDIAGMLPADAEVQSLAREALCYVERQLAGQVVMPA